MNTFFSLFGKLVLILLVIGALVFGGYYLGKKYNIPFLNSVTTPTTTTAVVSIHPSQMVVSASPTPNQMQSDPHVAITAGGVAPFSKYLMSGFKSWTKTEDKTSAMDKVTLTQGNYQVIILQAAVGGGGCTFPGGQPQQMSVTLTDPHEILLLSGAPLQRGTAVSANANQMSYTICQKAPSGSFGSLTDFGVINYTTPLNPDPETLAMMDAMIGSLQKQ